LRSDIIPLILLAAFAAAAQQPSRTDTIVVTGAFEPMTLEEIDRAIRVLPVRGNTLLFDTLADVLRLDPSLDLQERAPGGVQADLSIRGSNFGETLILLNGQRLNDVQSGHHNMDIPVPLDSISRVEVMRGSGSTLYGSDAAAGVVNIITTPPEGLEFRLRTAIGNFGTNQERGSIAAGSAKISEQLTFARDFSSGFMPDRDYRNLQFGSTTHLSSGWGASDLTLAYMDHPFGADQFYGPYNSWEDTKTWFAGMQQAFGERTTASFSYRRHSDLFVLFRDQPDVFANHHSDESWDADLRRRDPLSANTTVFYGVEAIHESIVSNNLGDHARSRAAAYGAVDFRALRRFSLTLSAREEVYRSFSAEFSPTVAGGFWISPKLKLRASASRAFRVPSYTDLYYHDPANAGNPNLRPERVWAYEGGLDWVPASRVRGDLTIFERRERDGIDYYRSSPTDLWRALNIQSLDFTGVEASLKVDARKAGTVDISYTGLRGVQDTIPLGFTKYTFNYPVHSAVAAWQATLGSGFIVRTRIGMLDRRARDPYALWDFYTGFVRWQVHPFLQLANITGTSYQEVLGVPMPGRTIIGGVEWVLRRH
jgi:outer membrane cobalamin receptor